MNVIILTSALSGTAAYNVPFLHANENINVKMVVYSEGGIVNKKKFYKRKLKKIIKIGLLGTLNGIRMRKWYSQQSSKLLSLVPLDTFCRENNIPFEKVERTNCKRTRELFSSSGADLGISLGNGYISKRVFSIPKFGMINIHHEQLPQYQNAQSIIWQIYNLSAVTGYTIHQINQKIDNGKVLYQEEVPIVFKDTLGETVANTYALQKKKSTEGLIKVLENFEDYFSMAQKQESGNSYTTPSIFQFARILWNFNKLKKMAK